MEYLRVQWKHDHADEPVWLYCELDTKRWETRKVEVFRDGTTGYADKCEQKGGTKLGLAPDPSIEEIAEDPQFLPSAISKEEFEHVWNCRTHHVHDDLS